MRCRNMSPPPYMIPLLVLLVLVCYGSALRPLSYRCLQPPGGSNDPACTLMGDVYTCTTNGSVVPYLSDGLQTTQYLWQGSSSIDLDIPNSVCFKAIVMTFRKQASAINLPGFTLEQTTAFNTTYPSSSDGVDNTTITFTQQYCQPTIRINMAQTNPAHFIILLEVFLIQPADSSTPPPDPPTLPPTNPASSSSTTTSQVTTAPTTGSQQPTTGSQPKPSPSSTSSSSASNHTAAVAGSPTPAVPPPQANSGSDSTMISGVVVPVVAAVVGCLLVVLVVVLVVVVACLCVGRRERWKPLALKTSSVRFRNSMRRKSAFNDPEYIVSKDSPRPEIIVIRNSEEGDEDSIKGSCKQVSYAAVGPSESIHRDVAAVLSGSHQPSHAHPMGRTASQESIHSRDIPSQGLHNNTVVSPHRMGEPGQEGYDGRTDIFSPNTGSEPMSPSCNDRELLVKQTAGGGGGRRTAPPVPVQSLPPATDGGDLYSLPPDSTRDDTYEVPPDSKPDSNDTYDLPPDSTPEDSMYDLPPDSTPEDSTYDLPPDSKPEDSTYDLPPDSTADDTYEVPPDCVQPQDSSGLYDLPPDSFQVDTYEPVPIPSQTDTYESPHDALESNVYEPTPVNLQANAYEQPSDAGKADKGKKKSFWKRSKKEKSTKTAAESEPVVSKGSKKGKDSKKIKRSSSQGKKSPPLPAIPPPQAEYLAEDSVLYESPDSILPPGRGGSTYAKLDEVPRPPKKPARATKTRPSASPPPPPQEDHTYSAVNKPSKQPVAPPPIFSPPRAAAGEMGLLYAQVDMEAKKEARRKASMDTFDQDFWGGENDPVVHEEERPRPSSQASQDHLYSSVDFASKTRPMH